MRLIGESLARGDRGEDEVTRNRASLISYMNNVKSFTSHQILEFGNVRDKLMPCSGRERGQD
jgi:hypothetical protein